MITITITASGQGPILAALSRRSGPELARTLKKATRAGAVAARPFIQAQAPVRTGATKRSVSVRATRHVGEIAGASVGPRTWYRHFPIGGTSRGVRPNPWVDRGAQQGGAAYRAAFNAVVSVDVRR